MVEIDNLQTCILVKHNGIKGVIICSGLLVYMKIEI